MKLFNYFIILSFIFSACSESEVVTPVLDEDYGEGMYIITDMGVSFYNYQDSIPEVINQIFKKLAFI